MFLKNLSQCAKFLKWNKTIYIFGIVHYHFYGYQDENLKV